MTPFRDPRDAQIEALEASNARLRAENRALRDAAQQDSAEVAVESIRRRFEEDRALRDRQWRQAWLSFFGALAGMGLAVLADMILRHS